MRNRESERIQTNAKERRRNPQKKKENNTKYYTKEFINNDRTMKWAAHGEEQHGIGLKNVKKIVEKYNGTMEGTTQEGIFCVNSPILLGIPNSEILSFDGNKIVPIDYFSTESYI